MTATMQATSVLIEEIETWLRNPRRTAHRLVSKPTAELVAEALASMPAKAPETLPAPRGVFRWIPGGLVRSVGRRRPQRTVSIEEMLGLTEMILTRYGWTGSGKTRSLSGRRCIAGAMRLLVELGYGDVSVMESAGVRLDRVLWQQNVRVRYYEWNDQRGRTQAEVMRLIKKARNGT